MSINQLFDIIYSYSAIIVFLGIVAGFILLIGSNRLKDKSNMLIKISKILRDSDIKIKVGPSCNDCACCARYYNNSLEDVGSTPICLNKEVEKIRTRNNTDDKVVVSFKEMSPAPKFASTALVRGVQDILSNDLTIEELDEIEPLFGLCGPQAKLFTPKANLSKSRNKTNPNKYSNAFFQNNKWERKRAAILELAKINRYQNTLKDYFEKQNNPTYSEPSESAVAQANRTR